jgi:hypothetical protein
MSRPVEPALAAARASGAKRYLSAKACPRGHFERFTCGSGCYVCAMDRQRERNASKPKAVKPPMTKRRRAIATTEARAQSPINCFGLGALDRYHNSVEAKAKSAYLNSLLPKVSST